jgi:Methyltransferase domain
MRVTVEKLVHRSRGLLRELISVRKLPLRVVGLYLRCLGVALASRDRWSLHSATRPYELAKLLEVSRGRLRVAEIGTGTAWTTMALALADSGRRVVTYDPEVRPMRDRYLSLIDKRTRGRIELIRDRGERGPEPGATIDMLFIDGDHSREATCAAFRAWEPALDAGGVAAFHDYDPVHQGVIRAIDDLDLDGAVFGNVFLWHKDPLGEETLAPAGGPASAS